MAQVGRPLNLPETFYEEDFLGFSQKHSSKLVYRRCLSLHMIQQKKSITEVALLVHAHRCCVQNWVKEYINHGLSGLVSLTHRRGRKPIVDHETALLFKEEFLEEQAKRPGGRLTGRDARELLAQRYALNVGKDTAYHLLHRVGLSWKSGRDIHPKANQKQQEAFKKTLKNS